MNRLLLSVYGLLVSVLALPVCAYELAQTAPRAAVAPRAQVADLATSSRLTADVLYRLLAAELAAQRGQYELAGSTLLDVARETQDSRLAQRAFQLAMVNRDVTRAFAAARQWTRLAPMDPQASAAVLALIVDIGHTEGWDEALAYVQAMRTRAPENFDLLYVQAQVHAQARQYAQARALLDEYIQVQTQRRQSLAQDGTHDARTSIADARLLWARIAEQEGDLDEALAQLERVDESTVAFQVQLARASLLAKQGNIARARATLENLAPRDVRERVLLAQRLASIYRDSGRTDDAVRVLEEAARADPGALLIQYDLAMLYERQGRMEDFEARLQGILAVDPDNANANNALGYTLADQNRRLDEAQVLLERAEQLEPDNPYILDSVGWYHYRRGDLERALHYLRRSWDGLQAADVAAHLGEVLWVMQQTDAARTVWQEGLQLDPENAVLRKTLDTLGVTLP